MKKTAILFFFLVVFLGCDESKISSIQNEKIDSINVKTFFQKNSLCDLTLAKGFDTINPQIIPWATDTANPYAESYIIDGKRLMIIQSLKQIEFKDSSRLYYFNNKKLKTIRLINDSLDFNFNEVILDYGNKSKNIFKKGTQILLCNEPTTWTGLANQYRFIQLFDLSSYTCYECFTNYYSCFRKK